MILAAHPIKKLTKAIPMLMKSISANRWKNFCSLTTAMRNMNKAITIIASNIMKANALRYASIMKYGKISIATAIMYAKPV